MKRRERERERDFVAKSNSSSPKKRRISRFPMQRRDRNGLKTREISSLTREKNFVLAEREKERGEGGPPICRRGEQVLFARGKEEQQVEERKNRFSFKKSMGHPIVEKNTDRIPRRIAMSRHRYTERERERRGGE